MQEAIKEGYMVFVSDGDSGIGSVREIAPSGRSELVVYVENAGDFVVPIDAVEAVYFGKVVLTCNKLDYPLCAAIGHAHDAEDPDYIAPPADEEP